jgi:hypothetical protein
MIDPASDFVQKFNEVGGRTVMLTSRIHQATRSVAIIAIGISLCWMPAPAFSQASQSETITMIVPYPAGGPTDLAARLVAPGCLVA